MGRVKPREEAKEMTIQSRRVEVQTNRILKSLENKFRGGGEAHGQLVGGRPKREGKVGREGVGIRMRYIRTGVLDRWESLLKRRRK